MREVKDPGSATLHRPSRHRVHSVTLRRLATWDPSVMPLRPNTQGDKDLQWWLMGDSGMTMKMMDAGPDTTVEGRGQ